MAVPYVFANATSAIPLSNLDNNFSTPVTIGNVAIQLGNTATTLGNVTMANVTITSVSSPITVTQGGTGNSSAFTANAVVYAPTTSTTATSSTLKWNNTYLGVGSGTTGLGTVEIQTGSTTAALWVQTGGTTSSYTVADFRTGSNAPALTIFGDATSAFYKTVAVGGATPSTSGAGITFPATVSLSSDANTLDDYEEGTWTPSVGGNATYTGRWGTYTKVGNLVTVMFNIGVNVLGTGSTTLISGLPFAINNPTYANDQSGCLSFFSNIATSVYCLNLRGSVGGTTLFFSGTTATTTSINNSVTVFGNSTSIQAAITYQTTA
jgi:hypothetical protein